MLYKTNNKCLSVVRFAPLNRTFYVSPHENICTIALKTIHYLYTIFNTSILLLFHPISDFLFLPLTYILSPSHPLPLSSLNNHIFNGSVLGDTISDCASQSPWMERETVYTTYI